MVYNLGTCLGAGARLSESSKNVFFQKPVLDQISRIESHHPTSSRDLKIGKKLFSSNFFDDKLRLVIWTKNSKKHASLDTTGLI